MLKEGKREELLAVLAAFPTIKKLAPELLTNLCALDSIELKKMMQIEEEETFINQSSKIKEKFEVLTHDIDVWAHKFHVLYMESYKSKQKHLIELAKMLKSYV